MEFQTYEERHEELYCFHCMRTTSVYMLVEKLTTMCNLDILNLINEKVGDVT